MNLGLVVNGLRDLVDEPDIKRYISVHFIQISELHRSQATCPPSPICYEAIGWTPRLPITSATMVESVWAKIISLCPPMKSMMMIMLTILRRGKGKTCWKKGVALEPLLRVLYNDSV